MLDCATLSSVILNCVSFIDSFSTLSNTETGSLKKGLYFNLYLSLSTTRRLSNRRPSSSLRSELWSNLSRPSRTSECASLSRPEVSKTGNTRKRRKRLIAISPLQNLESKSFLISSFEFTKLSFYESCVQVRRVWWEFIVWRKVWPLRPFILMIDVCVVTPFGEAISWAKARRSWGEEGGYSYLFWLTYSETRL